MIHLPIKFVTNEFKEIGIKFRQIFQKFQVNIFTRVQVPGHPLTLVTPVVADISGFQSKMFSDSIHNIWSVKAQGFRLDQ